MGREGESNCKENGRKKDDGCFSHPLWLASFGQGFNSNLTMSSHLPAPKSRSHPLEIIQEVDKAISISLQIYKTRPRIDT